jgi:hypothetical protein
LSYGGKRSALDVIFYDHEPLELEYDTQPPPLNAAAVVFDPFCWLRSARFQMRSHQRPEGKILHILPLASLFAETSLYFVPKKETAHERIYSHSSRTLSSECILMYFPNRPLRAGEFTFDEI